MQMKKITNFRLIFIVLIAMLVACAFAVTVFKSANSKLITFIVLLTLAVLFLILRLTTKLKIFTVFVCICFVICTPFLNLFIKSKTWKAYEKYNGNTISISGKICESKLYNETSSLYLVITDAKIHDEDKTVNIDGKISFYVKAHNLDLSKFKNGRYVEASGKFTFYSLDDKDIVKSVNKLSENIVAKGNVNYYELKILDRFEPSLRDKIRESVSDKLNMFAGDYFDVGYTMLFGDSSNLDDEVVDVFRLTGIAHILAVSGLHVSIIVLAINFLLKLVRSPKALNLVILSALLIFYSYLCDFSVSVIRASMMAVFLTFTDLRRKPYDRLTSLSLVATIILLISPLQLLNISFVLSFSAVLAIILLIVPFSRLFRKIFYKPVADSLALVSAVQVMMIISSIYYFGKYPVLGILTNFISIPVASIAFIFLIFTLLLSYIMPFLNVLLGVFSVLMSVVVKFNFWITSLGLVINFENLKFTAILSTMIIMYIVSDYVFVKKNTKMIACLITVLTCTFINLMFLI